MSTADFAALGTELFRPLSAKSTFLEAEADDDSVEKVIESNDARAGEAFTDDRRSCAGFEGVRKSSKPRTRL